MNITYSESFAGIGAWGKAIRRVTERHNDTSELQWYAEIDKYASNAFSAIHGVSENLNIWDITKDIEVKPMDIFFYSPPCQTFSIAGKRELTSVPKGNLFYDAVKFIKQTKPKYAIMENVRGLPSGDSKADFNNMLWYLEEIGYVNYWQILNTKDYGIPQNRERVFIVSIRKDLYDKGKRFEFPNKIKLEKKVKDYVNYEYEVPVRILESFNNKQGDFGERFNTLDGNGTFYTLTTKGCWGVITQNFYTRDLKKYTIKEIIEKNIKVFGTSPLTNFHLQGFGTMDYFNAVDSYNKTFSKRGNQSDAQMRIRTGNSITVNVIEEILENLLYDRKQIGQQLNLF